MSADQIKRKRLPENRVEAIVAFTAAATIVYSLVAFCFEAGFFWEIGIDYLPVFSIGEHLAHAGASFLVFLLFVLSLLCLFFIQAVVQHHVEARIDPAAGEAASGKPKPPLTLTRKIVVGLCVTPLLLVLAANLFGTLLPDLHRKFTPMTMFGVLAVVATAAHLVENLLGGRTKWWLGPAVLCGIFALPALGQLQYQSLIGNPGRSSFALSTAGRTVTGTMIFAGTSRFMMMRAGQLCLIDYELKSVLVLGPTRPATGPLRSAACGIELGT